MVTEDFYTGEPVITGSPPSFSQSNIIGNNVPLEEIEAANTAAFGKYDYDPGSRRSIPSSPVSIYPGGYGYNYPNYGGYYQQPYYGNYGIGANPYMTSPYGNPQPTYDMFRGGQPNPVFQPNYGGYYQPSQYQQQYQQPTSFHIPGVNFSGEYLPPVDFEQKVSNMQTEYWQKQQELEAKEYVDRLSQQSYYGFNYGYNYYGTPYYNPYQYNSLNNEIMQQVQAIKDEARENRIELNLKIARLAHNFCGHKISEEALQERYRGKDVQIPQSLIPNAQDYYEYNKLSSMVPFDNSQVYRDFHAAVSREFHSIVKEDGNLKDTFASMGIIEAQWEMEEEMHRRRDAGALYNNEDNSYKYFVRRKAQERYAREKGIQIMPNGQTFNRNEVMQSFVNNSPVLSQSAKLADDGTLNISLNIPCNVGSHKGETYTVHNSQEAEYDAKRERFGRFLDSIPGSIYLDSQKQKKMEGYSYG